MDEAGDETAKTVHGNENCMGGMLIDNHESRPVKVAVVVRPMLKAEKERGAVSRINVDCKTKSLFIDHLNKCYRFDHVFGGPGVRGSRFGELYSECVQPLLDGVLQGVNACVFAYGQTGSGKTYTMNSGGSESIIPQVAYNLFEKINGEYSQNSVKVSISFIEIYKETLRNLMVEDQPCASVDSKSSISLESSARSRVDSGILETPIASSEELLRKISAGFKRRVTSCHALNNASSRSHAIFTITIERSDMANDVHTTARFQLIDLAGSERVKRVGTGKTVNGNENLKEGIEINKSLFVLGKVISALGESSKRTAVNHIPFRDSKLTRILQDSLEGNSRTLMIVCVSPADDNLKESLNSLFYATRASRIKILPKRSNILNPKDWKRELEVKEMEIKYLKKKLVGMNQAPTKLNKCGISDEVLNALVRMWHRSICLETKLDSLRSILNVDVKTCHAHKLQETIQTAKAKIAREKISEDNFSKFGPLAYNGTADCLDDSLSMMVYSLLEDAEHLKNKGIELAAKEASLEHHNRVSNVDSDKNRAFHHGYCGTMNMSKRASDALNVTKHLGKVHKESNDEGKILVSESEDTKRSPELHASNYHFDENKNSSAANNSGGHHKNSQTAIEECKDSDKSVDQTVDGPRFKGTIELSKEISILRKEVNYRRLLWYKKVQEEALKLLGNDSAPVNAKENFAEIRQSVCLPDEYSDDDFEWEESEYEDPDDEDWLPESKAVCVKNLPALSNRVSSFEKVQECDNQFEFNKSEKPSLETISQIEKMYVAELKDALSKAGLPVSGKKSILKDRLLRWLSKEQDDISSIDEKTNDSSYTKTKKNGAYRSESDDEDSCALTDTVIFLGETGVTSNVRKSKRSLCDTGKVSIEPMKRKKGSNAAVDSTISIHGKPQQLVALDKKKARHDACEIDDITNNLSLDQSAFRDKCVAKTFKDARQILCSPAKEIRTSNEKGDQQVDEVKSLRKAETIGTSSGQLVNGKSAPTLEKENSRNVMYEKLAEYRRKKDEQRRIENSARNATDSREIKKKDRHLNRKPLGIRN